MQHEGLGFNLGNGKTAESRGWPKLPYSNILVGEVPKNWTGPQRSGSRFVWKAMDAQGEGVDQNM